MQGYLKFVKDPGSGEGADDDVMGAYEAINTLPYGDLDPWNSGEIINENTPEDNGVPINSSTLGNSSQNDYIDGYVNPLMEDDNFYSQVLLKTLGGKLPMIMRLDSSKRGTSDNFALVKFKNKSFKFIQKTPGIYTCKIDVEETW